MVEWLNEEKSRRKRRKTTKGSQQALPDTPNETPSLEPNGDDKEPDLSKLEHILSAFVKGSVMSTPKLAPKSPHILPRKGSIGRMLKRSNAPTLSSDTEFFGDEVLVPNVETILDNTKALAYAGGTGEDEASGNTKKKDQKNWNQFKEDVLTITHTLGLKGWRRIPMNSAADIDVARLSGKIYRFGRH